ncbi:MAG TPA: hypothetical protein VLD67_04000 [Vicinamibacterales bacterium]|nr:hypothetical protein [Vicinamibacterales bacterium]
MARLARFERNRTPDEPHAVTGVEHRLDLAEPGIGVREPIVQLYGPVQPLLDFDERLALGIRTPQQPSEAIVRVRRRRSELHGFRERGPRLVRLLLDVEQQRLDGVALRKRRVGLLRLGDQRARLPRTTHGGMESRSNGCRLGVHQLPRREALALDTHVKLELAVREQAAVDVARKRTRERVGGTKGLGEGRLRIPAGAHELRETVQGFDVPAILAEHQKVHERPGLRVERLEPARTG